MKRPLLVVGPPGSPKAELARRVGAGVGCPVLTADSSSLDDLLNRTHAVVPVIDVASDAWLNRDARVVALDRAVVISVRSPLGHDGARTASGTDATLWSQAKTAFDEAHLLVDWVSGKESECVEGAIEIWRRDPIVVAAGERSYVVDIGVGIFDARCRALFAAGAATLMVTDTVVEALYGERAKAAIGASGSRIVSSVFKAGEAQKHLGTLQDILQEALRGGIDRSCSVLAFGGGVVTDVGGLAAATWMRGLRWIASPTTLLGMVDASVGGKTAVDLGEAKNAVGAFWQPASVVCDVEWLRTESDRNYVSALAEVIKTAIIGDPHLFEVIEREKQAVLARDLTLMADVVRRCIRVKARIVGLDEREQGLRAVLNLGHTIGHALEALGGFGTRSHGEAISLGLVAACRLGVRLGVTPQDLAGRVEALLGNLGLPVSLSDAELRRAAEIVSFDKKRRDKQIRFVFTRGLGDVLTKLVGIDELQREIPRLAQGV